MAPPSSSSPSVAAPARAPKTSLPASSESPYAQQQQLSSSSAVLSHSSSYQNGIAEATTGLVKSRRLSFQQKTEATPETKSPAEAKGPAIPNVKELTSRQRNWFPNFEKGSSDAAKAPPETANVESARRESVKNDSVPQTVSNLELPGDRDGFHSTSFWTEN